MAVSSSLRLSATGLTYREAMLNSLICSRKETNAAAATNTKTNSSATSNGNLKFIYGCIAEQVSAAVTLNICEL
jgi:hypothetical protein